MVRGFRCYDNIARTRNVSKCLYWLYAWLAEWQDGIRPVRNLFHLTSFLSFQNRTVGKKTRGEQAHPGLVGKWPLKWRWCTHYCLLHHNRQNHFTALFPGPPRWADARRELLDFMVQGNINRGRPTGHPAGRHSIQTNQCPPPSSPPFFRGQMPFLSSNQQHQSTEGN